MTDKMVRKTVVITGSGKGIGRAIALKFAAHSYNVVLNYVHDETSAQEALQLCQRLTPFVRLVQANIAQRSGAEALLDTAYEAFGSLDILINNAGLNIDKPMQKLTEADWDQVVDTNMKGVFLCSQRAAAYMQQQPEGGSILNLGASTAIRGRVNGLNYCASKAGVLVMTKCLALELAPQVRVNCLIPGVIHTDEVFQRFDLDRAENLQHMVREIPLGRVAEPEEIADVAYFLSSPEARYITGQKIIVDGGQYMF